MRKVSADCYRKRMWQVYSRLSTATMILKRPENVLAPWKDSLYHKAFPVRM